MNSYRFSAKGLLYPVAGTSIPADQGGDYRRFTRMVDYLGHDEGIAIRFGYQYWGGLTTKSRIQIFSGKDDYSAIEVVFEIDENNKENPKPISADCFHSTRSQRILAGADLQSGETVFVVSNVIEAIQIHAVGGIAYVPEYDMDGDYISQARDDFRAFLDDICPGNGAEETSDFQVNIVVSAAYFDVEGIRDICRDRTIQCAARGIFEGPLGEVDALREHKDEFANVLAEAKRTVLSPFAMVGSSMASTALYAQEIKRDGAKLFQPRVSVGILGIDAILGGGLLTGATILAAEPGLGKTSLALYIALNIAKAGHLVLFYSQEMNPYELLAKAISRLSFERDGTSGLDYNTVRSILGRREGTPEELAYCHELLDSLSPNLHLAGGAYSVDKIKREVDAAMHAVNPGKRLVVVVDYLQYLNFEGRNTQEVVKKNIRDLRDMCDAKDIPALILSSISRDGYEQPFDKKYLKESGNIESDAVAILGLQYTNAGADDFNVDVEKGKEVQELSVVIGKSRFGNPHGKVDLHYRGAWGVFTEAETAPVDGSGGKSVRLKRQTRNSASTKKKG